MSPTDFIKKLNLKHPLIVAPMAGGVSSPALVIESSKAGALGSVGAAYSTAQQIEKFVSQVRSETSAPIAINLFIPQVQPEIRPQQILTAVQATEVFRKQLGLSSPQLQAPYQENFDQQWEAALKVKPEVFSFVFGLLKPEYIKAAKKEKIFLIGTATTLEEAMAVQESGADAVTLQGFEAGGHRGIFDANATDSETSLMNLIQECRSQLKIPFIAAGGIMSATDIHGILSQGASAVQMGTAFLACQESGISAAYKRAVLSRGPRTTKTTRAFSGRLARGIPNLFMTEMEKNPQAILPFPAQNKFTRDIRKAAIDKDTSDFLSLWAGTGQGSLWTGPVARLIETLFSEYRIDN